METSVTITKAENGYIVRIVGDGIVCVGSMLLSPNLFVYPDILQALRKALHHLDHNAGSLQLLTLEEKMRDVVKDFETAKSLAGI